MKKNKSNKNISRSFDHNKIEAKWPRTDLTSRRKLPGSRSRGAIIRGKREYDHLGIEAKWRSRWNKDKIYTPNLENAKKPFFNLMMFPYPSAEGQHVGNMYAFSGADMNGRFYRMRGYDVFEPMGLDGFGIHSENYAIKVGKHPKKHAADSEKNFYRQLSEIGNSFAWDYRLETYDPDYYRWTQWIFVKLFKEGLAYRSKATVNWCPDCKTVLADEQVMTPAQAGKEAKNFDDSPLEDPENAQVCERCGTVVVKKEMSSWYFRITEYADRLLENVDGVTQQVRSSSYDAKAMKDGHLAKSERDDTANMKSLSAVLKARQVSSVKRDYDVKKHGLMWPKKIKIAQRNWIGKKAGINITYKIKGSKETVTCFTTRPDTNFGATFIVVSPEYAQENLIGLVGKKDREKVSKYIDTSLSKSEKQRLEDEGKKTGVFTGLHAINQLNDQEMPIYVADFVLSGVGTGAVVGVPGHDRRDFEFAQAFDLPIIRVVVASDGDESEIKKVDQVQEDEGVMVNSEFLNGLDIHEATKKIMDHLEEKGWGERVFNYHLRDWLISRQRYWGPPIPMIYCGKCAEVGKSWHSENPKSESRSTKQIRNSKLEIRNFIDSVAGWPASNTLRSNAGWYPVPEKSLPIELPDIKDFKPKGDGTSPLSNAPDSWKYTKCPGCGVEADRELDVSDTFLDSSWYFLGYPNLKTDEWKNGSTPFNKKITKKWLPVNAYIGGAEHAVLHLLYARFVTMVLSDLGYIDFEEPFPFLYAHGLLISEGGKMSKSRGNVVNPDEQIKKFGADTLRAYLRFMGPFDEGGDFRMTGIEGMHRFMKRVWDLFQNENGKIKMENVEREQLLSKMHQTIKKVTDDFEQLKYNTALAAIMEFVNLLREVVKSSNEIPQQVRSSSYDAKAMKDGHLVKSERDDKSSIESLPDLSKADHGSRTTDHIIRFAGWDEAMKVLCQLLAPYAPHMTEEIWTEILGNEYSVHTSKWPKYNESLIKVDQITIAVQVNGKLRSILDVARGKAKDKEYIIGLAKKDQNVSKWIEGKQIKKEVFVPGKLVNFVTQ